MTGRDLWTVAIVVVLGCLLLVMVINKRPQVAVVGLQMAAALCWVCVGLTLAQRLWLNASLSAVGAVAFGAASAEVRRGRS